jgi:hypothetical protein
MTRPTPRKRQPRGPQRLRIANPRRAAAHRRLAGRITAAPRQQSR